MTDSSASLAQKLNRAIATGSANLTLRSQKATSRASCAIAATVAPAMKNEAKTSFVVQCPAAACAAFAGPLQSASQLTARIAMKRRESPFSRPKNLEMESEMPQKGLAPTDSQITS